MHGFEASYVVCWPSIKIAHVCPWGKWTVWKVPSKHGPTVHGKGAGRRNPRTSLQIAPKLPESTPPPPTKVINRWGFAGRRTIILSPQMLSIMCHSDGSTLNTIPGHKVGRAQSSTAPVASGAELRLFKMDFLHRSGVLIIQHLQRDYRVYYDFLHFMSNVGDPRNTFSIYFPLWFQLNQAVGTKMIWVAVIGDWFNLIF